MPNEPCLIDLAARPNCRAIVAIPVRDEVDRIGRCLRALARQQDGMAADVLLLINNTTDGTTAGVRELAPSLPIRVYAVEHVFPPPLAHAGHARRLAMDHAAAMLEPGGVLLGSDADATVPADWVAANLYHIRNGADAVAGRAVLNAADTAAIPAHLLAADAAECAYGVLLDEIDALLDPDPADPLPRHTEHSGASIAVTLEAYRRCGGVPAVQVGEDRALFAALRRIDAAIRHAPEIEVVVSGRTVGRAPGGMADTIRRRLVEPDRFLDDALEPAKDRVRRARLRGRLRRGFSGHWTQAAADVAGLLGLRASNLVQAATFGEAWQILEHSSPVLRRHRVAVEDLPREMAAAMRLRDGLRFDAAVSA